jgi:hypothetical protein
VQVFVEKGVEWSGVWHDKKNGCDK